MIRVLHGDCREVLKTLDADSIDACVTDPPYHLTANKRGGSGEASDNPNSPAGRARIGTGFMGKQWDGGDVAFQPETWIEVMRVLKPGAHLLAFGGTRTYHALATAIEAAGFEIRDAIMWHYGSGFPKSHDISKAIDKAAGVERPVVGKSQWTQPAKSGHHGGLTGDHIAESDGRFQPDVTVAATPEAAQWEGWGTALKPATEIICMARKPPSEPTVAANVVRFGCGAINIDASRIEGTRPEYEYFETGSKRGFDGGIKGGARTGAIATQGRWPANVIHDGSEEVLAAFPVTVASTSQPRNNGPFKSVAKGTETARISFGHADEGSAARFFYTAKADKSDRQGSKHPTVKPLDLMRYLVRLVTPPGGTVLDPFCGTGSTLVAADQLQFNAVGIEREAEYVADARRKFERDAGLFAEITS